MNNEAINLYEHFKNTEKKLKIVCDWDEVIQAAEPYCLWKGINSKTYPNNDFEWFFKEFWAGAVSQNTNLFRNQWEKVANIPDIYHQLPFLTIAEDLLKLIKEGKVEELIFLSTSDDRKYEVFKETFLNLKEIDKVCLKMMTDFPQYQTKAEWIEKNAPDFDVFIDDNPNICREVIDEFISSGLCRSCRVKRATWTLTKEENMLMSCAKCPSKTGEVKTILAPHYPILEKKHDERLISIKNEVSDLKKEDFSK